MNSRFCHSIESPHNIDAAAPGFTAGRLLSARFDGARDLPPVVDRRLFCPVARVFAPTGSTAIPERKAIARVQSRSTIPYSRGRQWNETQEPFRRGRASAAEIDRERRPASLSGPSAWPGDSPRVSGDYLRKQAAACLAWARECFDLETATRLRLMAEEFKAKANEIEASWNM